jgi:hypothetical protein
MSSYFIVTAITAANVTMTFSHAYLTRSGKVVKHSAIARKYAKRGMAVTNIAVGHFNRED